MAKRVCIVGAGPSGLVAAKTLLHNVAPGTFSVTIYDAQTRIGGLWPLSRGDAGGLVHPLMVANQSKHTVQFSDLAWEDDAPQLPRAWQVGQYLERYLARFGGGADVRLGHRVVRTSLGGDGSWTVETQTDEGLKTAEFDYLLISTGFFGQPTWPSNVPRSAQIPIVHSSKYRNLNELLSGGRAEGGKILIVGGQMSGIEIAGTIATHLSSARHTPGEKPILGAEKYSIHHVSQRPSWIFPLFTSPKPGEAAPPFVPCDVTAYNLSNRPLPLINTQADTSVEHAKRANTIYQGVMATDQTEFSADLALKGEILDEPPHLAMSSHYADFFRDGTIKMIKGRFSSLDGTTASIGPTGEQVGDVAAIILATGFDPAPSLAYLPDAVKETIAHDPNDQVIPAALAFHATHHASYPSLGFVGFYRSPYWGVMEMQARFIAHLWTSPNISGPLKQALEDDTTIERMLALRKNPRIPQFPMGDYGFLMQEFSNALGMTISEPRPTPLLGNEKIMDMLTPARFTSSGATETDLQEVDKNLASTNETVVSALTKGKFVAGAVFRSLLGEWKLERDLESRLPSHPSGKFVGTAKFLLREGTRDGREGGSSEDADLGMEYLYVEDGEFTASSGMTFRATRRYVWRYDEGRDALSVWFARTDDNLRADYLFHEVEFVVRGEVETDKEKGWEAKASHLCIEDLYDVRYEFKFRSVNLAEWSIAYSVSGPKKDYSIAGRYRR